MKQYILVTIESDNTKQAKKHVIEELTKTDLIYQLQLHGEDGFDISVWYCDVETDPDEFDYQTTGDN